MALTRTRMIEACLASDGRFDGRFYLCVTSTKIYCKPSCRARKPKPQNVIFVESVEDAIARGFRACKRCRPDEPSIDDTESKLAEIWAAPHRFAGAAELGQYLGKKPTALADWTRMHTHRTPLRLLNEAKVEYAMTLLRDTDSPVGEVAMDSGFESLSAFYARFSEFTGLAPAAYRALGSGREFAMDLPSPSSAAATMRTLGRDPNSPTERTSGCTLACVVGDEVVQAEVSGATAKVSPSHDGFATHRTLRRYFGLGQDAEGFRATVEGAPIEHAFRAVGDLRVPWTADPYEALAWSIIGQQIALPFAYQLRRSLYELAADAAADGFRTRLIPERVAEIPIDALLARKFSRRKAEYLLDVSRSIAEGKLSLDRHRSAGIQERELLDVRGLGPWSVNYVMMRGLGFADCLPLGDTGVQSALRNVLESERKLTLPEIETAMQPYRPHRSLATYLLWQSLGGAA